MKLIALLHISLLFVAAAVPQVTATCKRDILPEGGSISVSGLPGGTTINSGGGKTVISVNPLQ